MRDIYAQPLRLRDDRSPVEPAASEHLQETEGIRRPKPYDLDEGDITPR